MTGGTCWDVFWMDTSFYLKDYVDRGVLVDITPYIERDGIDLSNYPEGILKIHEYKGRYYLLSRDYDTIALFYNKDMFDKAGLEYPDETWMWTDLILAAEKLTIRDEKGRVKQVLSTFSRQLFFHRCLQTVQTITMKNITKFCSTHLRLKLLLGCSTTLQEKALLQNHTI